MRVQYVVDLIATGNGSPQSMSGKPSTRDAFCVTSTLVFASRRGRTGVNVGWWRDGGTKVPHCQFSMRWSSPFRKQGLSRSFLTDLVGAFVALMTCDFFEAVSFCRSRSLVISFVYGAKMISGHLVPDPGRLIARSGDDVEYMPEEVIVRNRPMLATERQMRDFRP
jgi:hypothetical protein